MQDGIITIHGRKGDPKSTVKVHLSFDVPDKVMKSLIDCLSEGIEKWQNLILNDKGEQYGR